MLTFPTEPLRQSARVGLAGADRVARRVGVSSFSLQGLVARFHLGAPLHPRRPIGRPAGRRLALTFDLDYQRDTDALDGLTELVGAVGGRMSVCSIAALVERDPAPYRRAIAAGHELVNHSWTHPDNPVLDEREFWHLERSEVVEQVGRANDVFERQLGVRASGFRTPHFKDVSMLVDVLADDKDTRYVSSVLGTATMTGLPYLPAGSAAGRFGHAIADRSGELMQLPLTACPAHRWSPFCSYHHLRVPSNPRQGAGMHDLADFERHWDALLERHADDGYLSFYFDPHDVMADGRTAAGFRRCLERSLAAGWELVTLAEMADAWRPHLVA